MDTSGIGLCMICNGKYDEESRKYLGGTKLLQVVHRGTLYLMLTMVLTKLPYIEKSAM